MVRRINENDTHTNRSQKVCRKCGKGKNDNPVHLSKSKCYLYYSNPTYGKYIRVCGRTIVKTYV